MNSISKFLKKLSNLFNPKSDVSVTIKPDKFDIKLDESGFSCRPTRFSFKITKRF